MAAVDQLRPSRLLFWRRPPSEQPIAPIEDPQVNAEMEMRQRLEGLDRTSILLALIHAGNLVITSKDIEALGKHLHDSEEPQSVFDAMTEAGMFTFKRALPSKVRNHPILAKAAFFFEEDEHAGDTNFDAATPTVMLPPGMQKAEPLFRETEKLREAGLITASPYDNRILVYGVTKEGKKHADVLQARTELLQVQPPIVIGRDKVTAGEYSFPIGNPLLPSAPQADR